MIDFQVPVGHAVGAVLSRVLWHHPDHRQPVNLKLSQLSQNGATSEFEMCFAPSTFGDGGKTRLESIINKIKPHFIYDTAFQAGLWS